MLTQSTSYPHWTECYGSHIIGEAKAEEMWPKVVKYRLNTKTYWVWFSENDGVEVEGDECSEPFDDYEWSIEKHTVITGTPEANRAITLAREWREKQQAKPQPAPLPTAETPEQISRRVTDAWFSQPLAGYNALIDAIAAAIREDRKGRGE